MRLIVAAAFTASALAAVSGRAAAASCSADAQPVIFGAYDSLATAPTDGVGNIHLACDTSVSFTVELGTGGGTVADRNLTGGADPLHYNLFSDASRTNVWGDGNGAAGSGATGQSADLPVYGRIAPQQLVPAGSYGDTVVVTVVF
jgi:spore coat protein U-like protein